jgi:hypothetical protein
MRIGVLAIACCVLSVAAGARDSRAGAPTQGVDPRIWTRFEYVNLWTPGPPLPFPLVTTGDAAGAGHLGAPGTRVLLGDGPLSVGSFPAGRFTIGAWFGFDENFGAEFTTLATGVRAAHYQAASDAAGNPLLAIPFSDVTSGTPTESSLVISQPGVRHGNISINDANAFFSADLDGLVELSDYLPGDMFRTTLLAGIRTMYFAERFQLDSVTTDLSGFSLGHNDIILDQDTFFGADFGLRGSRRFKRFTIELTGKAAIGQTWQVQYVTSQSGLAFVYPRLNSSVRQGFFTQPTNIGYTYPHRVFSVVPAARLRLGYDLTDRIRLTASYEAFLWTQLMRPSDQLDRQINLSQTYGPLVGVARPTLPNRHTDFWAQGFTVGLQFNY